MTFGTATSDGICGVTSDLSTVADTKLRKILDFPKKGLYLAVSRALVFSAQFDNSQTMVKNYTVEKEGVKVRRF